MKKQYKRYKKVFVLLSLLLGLLIVSGNAIAASFEVVLQGELIEEELGAAKIIYESEEKALEVEKIEGLELGEHEFIAKDFEGYELISKEKQVVELTQEQQEKEVVFEYKEEVFEVSFMAESPEPFVHVQSGYVDVKVDANREVEVELIGVSGHIDGEINTKVYYNNSRVAELKGANINVANKFTLNEGENTIRFQFSGKGIINSTFSFDKVGELK